MLQERSQWTTPHRRHQLASTCAEQFRSTSTELFQISLEVPVRGLQAIEGWGNPAGNAGRVEKIPLQSHRTECQA